VRLLYGDDKAVCRFVGLLINEQFDKARGIGVMDDAGKLVAGWVWHNWSPEARVMEFSGASTTPKWMTRAILHDIFAYAFDQMQCQMIVTRNSADNIRLHRQLRRFGFDRFDIPRLFGRIEDGVVWTLTEEQWRSGDFYIGETHGQEVRPQSA
jgi:hypothetical protein